MKSTFFAWVCGLAGVVGVSLSAYADGTLVPSGTWPKRTADIDRDTRIQEWKEFWTPGKKVDYDVSYALVGDFKISGLDGLSWGIRQLVTDANENLPFTVGVSGTQSTTILPLAASSDTGLWQLIGYDDQGIIRMGAQATIGDNKLMRNAMGRWATRISTRSGSSRYDAVRENYKKDHWAITAWFSEYVPWGDLYKQMNDLDRKRTEAWNEAFGDYKTHSDGDENTVVIDPLHDEGFGRELREVQLYGEVQKATLSFLEEFDGRLLFLYAQPKAETYSVPFVEIMEGLSIYYGENGEKKLDEVCAKKMAAIHDHMSPHSEATVNAWRKRVEKRRTICRTRSELIRSLEADLRAQGVYSVANLYRELGAYSGNLEIWVPKMSESDREDLETMSDALFFDVHHRNVPNGPALIWGVERLKDGGTLEFNVNCEGRQPGASWVFPGTIFNQYMHRDWWDYEFSLDSSVVVTREEDDTFEGRKCYVFRIEKESNQLREWQWDATTHTAKSSDPNRSKQTKLELRPKSGISNRPTFVWAGTFKREGDKLLNKIYIDKASGQILFFRIPFIAKVGNVDNQQVGDAVKGLKIAPNSTVEVDFSVALRPDDGRNTFLLKKVQEEHPLYSTKAEILK